MSTIIANAILVVLAAISVRFVGECAVLAHRQLQH